MPQFRFSVDIRPNLNGIPFQEVSGLDTESLVIEYRHGNSPVFNTIKMPGIAKYGNITLKRGHLTNGISYWDWYKQIK